MADGWDWDVEKARHIARSGPEEAARIAALDPRLPWWPMKRAWYVAPWKLANPLIGTPGCRPFVWRGGDEFGRSTLVIMLPLLGELVIATSPPCGWHASPDFPDSPDEMWSCDVFCPECGRPW